MAISVTSFFKETTRRLPGVGEDLHLIARQNFKTGKKIRDDLEMENHKLLWTCKEEERTAMKTTKSGKRGWFPTRMVDGFKFNMELYQVRFDFINTNLL